MKIIIFGAGNVGYHLALALADNPAISKENITIIINHKENVITKKLIKKKLNVLIGLENTPRDADVYILCVKDSVIQNVSDKILTFVPENAVVMHTSGATESGVLNKFKNFGVIYPLYSFSYAEKNINWSKVPLFIIANNEFSLQKITTLAHLLQPASVQIINDEQKLNIHLAAVFANNFINALMHAVYALCKNKTAADNLYADMTNFAIQTIQRIKDSNPISFQTGPAIRFDNTTIQKHLEKLESKPDLKQLYLCITKYIQTTIAHEIQR